MKGHKQTTDGTPYTTAYVYNLAGGLIEETYPSGRKVQNELDASGDLSVVKSKKNATSGPYYNYAFNFVYNAAGAVTSMELGNLRYESTVFNSRLQPTQIALGTTPNGSDKLKVNYTYNTTGDDDNNGNVLSQTITVPGMGQPFVQTYTYDSLNRLASATETQTGSGTTWNQAYGFDRYGNRNITSGLGATNFSFSGNRVTSHSFDAAGNTTNDGAKTFTYDSENKQTAVNNGSIGQYLYDGDGKRVKKYVPGTGETTIFVHDALGKLVAEYSTIVASVNDAKVAYLTNDHLGSPRINTDRDGNVTARHDYMPYGNEITAATTAQRNGYAADSVRKKFTGYERDEETGLDFGQARYYSSGMGRFYSADPENAGATEDDPQSWNAYAYVRNSPTTLIDPFGDDYKVCNPSGECVNLTNDQFALHASGLPSGYAAAGDKNRGVIVGPEGNVVNTYEYFQTAEQEAVARFSGGKAQMFSEYFYNKLKIAGGITLGIFAMPVTAGAAAGSLLLVEQAAPKIAAPILQTIGNGLKNIRPISSGRLAGFTRGNTELAGGEQAAKEVFRQIAGRYPNGSYDRAVAAGKEVVFRTAEKSGSGTSKIEVVDFAQKLYEKISFKP